MKGQYFTIDVFAGVLIFVVVLGSFFAIFQGMENYLWEKFSLRKLEILRLNKEVLENPAYYHHGMLNSTEFENEVEKKAEEAKPLFPTEIYYDVGECSDEVPEGRNVDRLTRLMYDGENVICISLFVKS